MLIELNDVAFAYPISPERPVLEIPNWCVEAGQHLFLYGPSGCGKSTLLKVIGGLLSVQSGQVHVLEQPLHRMRKRQRDALRVERMGFVFQQFNLIPYLDALRNVSMAAYFSKQRRHRQAIRESAELLLQRLHIDAALWRQPVGNLSIGQQQRVAIARALINKPALIIADEPTSALDEANTDAFMELLMELAEEQASTIVMVSHDRQLARYFPQQRLLSSINQVESRAGRM
jgi:putative ABC transport system ATP-binding protein